MKAATYDAAVLKYLLAIPAVIGLVLGIYWAMWHLWCWVLPQLWPTGPRQLIAPGFWLFVGAWLLASLMTGGIRRVFAKESRE